MRRFLIVRLGALGDIVHAIPVAAAIRRAIPSARIDWLVSAKHREILDLVPVIDRRLVVADRWGANGAEGGGQSDSRSIVAAIRELRRTQYDVAIDLQGLVKSALLAQAAGAATVLGFSAKYAREGLASLFYGRAYDPGRGGLYDSNETRHVVEINLGILELIDLSSPRVEFPIEAVQSAAAARASEEAGGRYALLNPGAAWPNKRWPAVRFGALASSLHARLGLKSVVLWGPGEEGIAHEAVSASNGAAVLSAPTNIADVVALARGAVVMVSGDTGPTHIATAVGTPLVGLYGPTRPCRNGSLVAADVILSRDAVCQCHHLRRCKLDRMCMLDIEVEEVLAAVERRLSVEPLRG